VTGNARHENDAANLGPVLHHDLGSQLGRDYTPPGVDGEQPVEILRVGVEEGAVGNNARAGNEMSSRSEKSARMAEKAAVRLARDVTSVW
jgi:hypothetical protein